MKVRIALDGNDLGREFQNMNIALTYAVHNGACINAHTLEFAYEGLNKEAVAVDTDKFDFENKQEAEQAGNTEPVTAGSDTDGKIAFEPEVENTVLNKSEKMRAKKALKEMDTGDTTPTG